MLEKSTVRTDRPRVSAAGGSVASAHVLKMSEDTAGPLIGQLRSAALDVLDWRRLDTDSLQALRALDADALRLLESMVAEYAAIGVHVQAQDRRLAKPAFELCSALAQAFECAIRIAGDGTPAKGVSRYPDLVVRLLRYRDIEMALTLCQFDAWQRARWNSLHELYRMARDQGVATKEFVIGQRAEGVNVTLSAEEIYLRILLLELAGSGRLLPSDIAAARRFLARCAGELALQSISACAATAAPAGFYVDPDAPRGLSRADGTMPPSAYWIDTTSIARAIDAELAALHGATADPGSERRIVLLSRLAPIYAVDPVHVKRRGERNSAEAPSRVEVVAGGLEGVYRAFRDDARHRAERVAAPATDVDEIVISVADAPRSGDSAIDETPVAGGVSEAGKWQLRDSSDSGCLLRGCATDLRVLLPGSLIAFRDDENAPWRLAVVRRLRKIVGTNVELGVERLAVGPQRIVLTDPRAPRDASRRKAGRAIAFYLPESPACPRIPIKTLVVPASEFKPGRVMVIASTRDLVIRMKEPLEQQDDFVWTTFEFVDDAR